MHSPVQENRFTVEWGGIRLGFTEVSGLTGENRVIDYRDGPFPERSATRMPALRKFSNVTLKRGVVATDSEFFRWLSTVKVNNIERRDLVISLLDEERTPVMTWKIQNAFPVKVESPALKATGNEVVIESIEIAHEGIEVQNE